MRLLSLPQRTLHALIENDKTYLYVDVGGGSTEFTVYSQGETVVSKSFKVGTVRLLNEMVSRDTWVEVEQWIKENTHQYENISLIGSGGNIIKFLKYLEENWEPLLAISI